MNSLSDQNNSPAKSFERLCQSMLDGSSKNLTKKNVEDFRVILHMITHECSKLNIETGKHWVFDHCHSPAHITALMDYIYTLSKARSNEKERIHLVYLINDVVYHIARKQLAWMRDAIQPLLAPFLKLVYDSATTPEYKAKITKVINFWYAESIFQSDIIDSITMNVTGRPIEPQPAKSARKKSPSPQKPQKSTDSPPTAPPANQTQYKQQQIPPSPMYQQQQQKQQRQQQPQYQIQQQAQRIPNMPYTQQYHPLGVPQIPIAEKPYYDMPAGLMLLAKSTSYEPLDPTMIKVPYPRPPPTKELTTAVDEFYSGMELVNSDDVILSEKTDQTNKDSQGWERGYLDGYMEAIQQYKRDMLERQKFMNAPKPHLVSPPVASTNKDAYNKHSSPSFSSGSPSRSRSRSRSHSRERSYSYNYSRSHSRSRSRSPEYRYHRNNNSSRRSRKHSYSRSRSRSPPPHSRGSGRRGSPPTTLRGRSPPRGRSPSGRGRRPSPPPYHSRGYSNRTPHDLYRRYSRSPSPHHSSSSFLQAPPPPPPSMHSNMPYSFNSVPQTSSNPYSQSRGESRPTFEHSLPPAMPAENRYMGLGTKSSSSNLDEFDSFRKNKSHAFSKREPHQPFACYKCNKVGHLARECTSL